MVIDKATNGLVCDANSILIESPKTINPSMKIQHKLNAIKYCGHNLIQPTDIVKAILKCSVDKYCNPMHKPSPKKTDNNPPKKPTLLPISDSVRKEMSILKKSFTVSAYAWHIHFHRQLIAQFSPSFFLYFVLPLFSYSHDQLQKCHECKR